MLSMKVALITGGSRGIGAAAVEQFAKNGYSVILNYNRSQAQAENLRARLLAEGCDVHLFKADVSSVAELQAMFGYVAKYFKKLDVLVNNAGVSLVKQIQDVTESDYDNVMSVNAKGAFFCCKLALPLLRQSGAASIVNVSSVWGVRGASCESVYSMSKHAVVGLTKSLAEELEQTGVTVSAICPPIVLTDMSAALTAGDVGGFCKQTGSRAYKPCEVAAEIYNLALSHTNGQILELL